MFDFFKSFGEFFNFLEDKLHAVFEEILFLSVFSKISKNFYFLKNIYKIYLDYFRFD